MQDRRTTARLTATLLVLSASLVLSCAAALPPEPTLSDARRAQFRWDDSSLQQLQEGLDVLKQRCSRCHRAPTPDSMTATSWPAQIDAMQDRAGLPAAERVMLERYLIIVADRPSLTTPSTTKRDRTGYRQPVISSPPVRQVTTFRPMR